MSKQKRALVIADANSFWTQRHIENLLLPEGYEVVLFPIWGNQHRYDAFYRENHITVYEDGHTMPIISRIPKLRMWARIALNSKDLKALGPFDVVHNHYLSRRDLALGGMIAKAFGAKWACSFWGSDLLRPSEGELLRMKPYLEKCDHISVHSQLKCDRIREVYGEAIARKTTLLYFGQLGYGDIDRVRAGNSKADCKAHFGIDPESFAVSIGYSASSAQHQVEALVEISKMPDELLSKMTIILQQTYGNNDPSYTKRAQELAASLPSKLVVLTEFMDATQSAYLRLAADVFVLAITTDAFSASMQEYLYAGACVIKGSWLRYPQLEDMGIEVSSFDEYAELPALLQKALGGEISGLTRAQRELFPKLYSWDAVRDSWLSLYR